MSAKELEELKENPPDVAQGWIYPEVRYHYVHNKLNEIQNRLQASIINNWAAELFIPEGSKQDILAHDCLGKTMNQALGFEFFTQREQMVRLTSLGKH
jgi:hypothetical protein